MSSYCTQWCDVIIVAGNMWVLSNEFTYPEKFSNWRRQTCCETHQPFRHLLIVGDTYWGSRFSHWEGHGHNHLQFLHKLGKEEKLEDKQKYGINVAFFHINFIHKRFNKFQDKLRYKKQLVWYSGSQENFNHKCEIPSCFTCITFYNMIFLRFSLLLSPPSIWWL